MRSLVAVLAAAAWLAPPPVSAQEPVASAVLYEVNEALRFVKRSQRDGDDRKDDSRAKAEVARRLAHASLLGKDVRPARPHDVFREGSFIQAEAHSNVDLAVGKGPITGKLWLLTDIDPTRESLDTLVVDTEMLIGGELDLTTAMQGFAAVSGRWTSSKGFKVRKGAFQGTFQGLFLIPFKADGEEGYFYLDLGGDADPCPVPEVVLVGGQPVPACPLESFEFALGIPLTKAVVTFLEGGR